MGRGGDWRLGLGVHGSLGGVKGPDGWERGDLANSLDGGAGRKWHGEQKKTSESRAGRVRLGWGRGLRTGRGRSKNPVGRRVVTGTLELVKG